MKHQIIKITTEFSELEGLDNREFTSIFEFDTCVMKLYHEKGDYSIQGFYDKTDVTIHFDDGETYSFRFDAQPGYTLITRFAEMKHYYGDFNKDVPDYIDPTEWCSVKRKYQKFFREYQI